ncbi:MAG: hypothetical protein ACTSRP_01025, partial [Candidatus Helarchaeota archaeon]
MGKSYFDDFQNLIKNLNYNSIEDFLNDIYEKMIYGYKIILNGVAEKGDDYLPTGLLYKKWTVFLEEVDPYDYYVC